MIKNILLGTLLLTFVLQSCTKRYDEINTNPNLQPVVSPEQLFAPALVNILSINMSRNYSFNNELMQVTVNMGDGDGKVFRYDIRTTWGTQPWNNLYLQLTNLKNVYSIADTSSRYKNDSYKGVSIILQSWVYSILTDTYGDIPYSESNLGRLEDGANRRPKFDKQKDIYMAIYDSLEVANKILEQSKDTITSNSDPVFKGDITKWRKFGNALYMRLLLRLSGKSEVAAAVVSKFQNIINNPVQYPIISSNSESAILRWSGSAVAAEPMSSPFNSMRVQDFRSPGLGEFFIGNLRNWNSPLIQTAARTAPTALTV
ncbi:SusD/RagB family nutrient-binding outer membrane lipoprotein [Niabella hibiscisoli]|uniref:SusD/RagB family nutrient-binding outer membrane lipoprotein n=1 Tax=Niabella hibiscisoli TaxID=1825928 RepID=UPI0021D40785|nr:SusD/RagB family nutrient-binding outer membrane lipoprotein [Niabella hibiscisoli]